MKEQHRKRIGKLILIMVILFCIPLTIPKVLGYQVYHVISGSMHPSIPINSVVYVEKKEAAQIQKGDIIAFYSVSDSGAIITHRVVKNQVVSGQFVTKGDANNKEDIAPVPYEYVIGKVVLSVPLLGGVFSLMTTLIGKIVVGCLVLIGTYLVLKV